MTQRKKERELVRERQIGKLQMYYKGEEVGLCWILVACEVAGQRVVSMWELGFCHIL